jgi:LPXTG-site transpeptidase (sortase) family protein
MNLTRVLIITGILLFIFGISVKVIPQVLASPEPEVKQQVVTPEDLVKINIPNANVQSNVVEGAVDGDVWKLVNNAVLTIKIANPDKSKTATLIYGHNFKNLFQNLKDVQVGDNIYLTNEKGEVFIYQVYSKEDINPKQVDKLSPQIDHELILYTCDGILDTQRVLVKATQIN